MILLVLVMSTTLPARISGASICALHGHLHFDHQGRYICHHVNPLQPEDEMKDAALPDYYYSHTPPPPRMTATRPHPPNPYADYVDYYSSN